MDALLKITLLYDFYGELLTGKQKQVYEMYYQNDLSLSEIAQELSISRQAVRDQLKRTEKILIHYEETLSLVARFAQQQKDVRRMKYMLEEIEADMGKSQKMADTIDAVKQIADKILS